MRAALPREGVMLLTSDLKRNHSVLQGPQKLEQGSAVSFVG